MPNLVITQLKKYPVKFREHFAVRFLNGYLGVL